MNEVDIAGYGGRYRIDDYGNVWRVYRTKRAKMKAIVKPRGNLEIKLTADDGSRHTHNVSRLVALHFIPRPYMADSVIHKNGNKQDAYVDNLMWVSRRQVGLRFGHKIGKAKPVCKIDQSGETVEVYHSARAAAKANYMSYQTVLSRCNGIVKGKYAPDGYEYKYAEDAE